jgi:dTMP kinase
MATLKRMNKTACIRIHPTDDNLFGKKARAFLLSKGKSAHFASALFYMVDVIRSILLYSWRRVDYVVFVRYLMGTAYLPSPLHVIGYYFFAIIVPKSKTMFFLDVNAEVAATRIAEHRNEVEMFESFEALKKVRGKALLLTSFNAWTVIDSNKPACQVALALNKSIFTQ